MEGWAKAERGHCASEGRRKQYKERSNSSFALWFGGLALWHGPFNAHRCCKDNTRVSALQVLLLSRQVRMDAAQTKVIHQQHISNPFLDVIPTVPTTLIGVTPQEINVKQSSEKPLLCFWSVEQSVCVFYDCVCVHKDALNKGSHLGELEGWPQLWQLSESAAAKPVRLLFLFPTSTSSGDPLVRHIGIELLAWSLITATLAEQRGQ
ncbi:uncharacterized [Tachysurus ichikawai]